MNYSGKAQIASLAAIIVLIGAFGGYYFDTSSVLAGRDQTISSLRSQINSLVSNPTTHTVTSTSNPTTATVTSTSTLIQTVVSQRNYTSTVTFPPPSILAIQIAKLNISSAHQIVFNANTNRVYLFDPRGTELIVIDASNHKVIGNVALPGTGGFGIAIDQKLNRIYVASFDGNVQKGFIAIVDGLTNSIVGNISIAVNRIAVNPNTNTIYGTWANHGLYGNVSNSLLIIDGNTKSLIANVTLNAFPGEIKLNPTTNMLYIPACQRVRLICEGPEILAVNGTSHVVQSKITSSDPGNFGGFDVLVDPRGTVYARGWGDPNLKLYSLDPLSNKLVALSVLGSSCAAIQLMDFDLRTNQIYAITTGDTHYNYLLIIDASTGHISNMFSLPGHISYAFIVPDDPHGLSINPNLKEIYLTTSTGTLWILNSTFPSSYVDTGLLQVGNCQP